MIKKNKSSVAKNILPERTVERLSKMRRILLTQLPELKFIYSHEIAKLMHITPVQVRRDLMLMGYTGTPSRGYDLQKLIESIGKTIDPKDGFNALVVGMGNLGNAIVRYIQDKREKLKIVATFDSDTKIINKCGSKVKCYHIDELKQVVKELKISIGIITVPAHAAIEVNKLLIESGISGIINFTSTPLNVPHNIFLEEYDIITSLEKTAYFVKQ